MSLQQQIDHWNQLRNDADKIEFLKLRPDFLALLTARYAALLETYQALSDANEKKRERNTSLKISPLWKQILS